MSADIFWLSQPGVQRRKWQPTPVLLPRESCGQRSLAGCCPQRHTESDTTEATQHACMHWRRKWQPTPVFLPGESQGWGSLVGCCLWGHTESDTTEATQQQQQPPGVTKLQASIQLIFIEFILFLLLQLLRAFQNFSEFKNTDMYPTMHRATSCNQKLIVPKYHFANKGPYSQNQGFPVVMYRCESWTLKKAEC